MSKKPNFTGFNKFLGTAPTSDGGLIIAMLEGALHAAEKYCMSEDKEPLLVEYDSTTGTESAAISMAPAPAPPVNSGKRRPGSSGALAFRKYDQDSPSPVKRAKKSRSKTKQAYTWGEVNNQFTSYTPIQGTPMAAAIGILETKFLHGWPGIKAKALKVLEKHVSDNKTEHPPSAAAFHATLLLYLWTLSGQVIGFYLHC
jgi:hypothetical protein